MSWASTLKRFQLLALVVVLLFSLHLRLNTSSYPYQAEDGNRDYLIARHLLVYHEYPQTGPITSFFNTLTNSPIYYYFLAVFLMIKDDILSLLLVNIIWQVINLVLIYLIARRLFDGLTGLLAVVIFGISQFALDQSQYFIWQPWWMQPVIDLSYLLLGLSYFHKKYSLLLLGLACISLAIVFHSSALAMVPAVGVLSWLILQKIGLSWIKLIGAFGTVVVVLILAFWPAIPTMSQVAMVNHGPTFNSLSFQPTDYLPHFVQNLTILLNLVFGTNNLGLFPFNYLILVIFLALNFYQIWRGPQKIKVLIILGWVMILQPILVLSFFNLAEPSLYNSQPLIYGLARYFTPVLGILVIMIAYTFRSSLTLFRFSFLGTGLVLALFLFIQNPNLLTQSWPVQYPNSWRFNDPEIWAIENKVLALKNEQHLPNLKFFQLVSYGQDHLDASFWVPLERDLNQKFTTVIPQVGFYFPDNQDQYVFLICRDPQIETCTETFTGQNPNYELTELVYSNQSKVYLLKRVKDRLENLSDKKAILRRSMSQ